MHNKDEDIALFWYKLIEKLLYPGLSTAKRKKIIKEITGNIHNIPWSARNNVTEANLKKKLYLYRKYGFHGLKPKVRSDKDDVKAVPADILEKALQLKEELPSRSVRTIIRIMKMSPDIPWDGQISIATLSRHFKKRGYTRKLLTDPDRDVFTMFRYEKINQMWQGDCMHGPFLPHPTDKRRTFRTKLFAFKDDCSSLITGAVFYPDETLPSMEDCLKKAILLRGLPHAIYVDNGKVYHAQQFQLILAELGVRLYHATPYQPEGKGKIESFFAFVQSDFVPEAKMEIKAGNIQTLSRLNEYFQAWLEINYHHKIHTVLKRTPISIWCEQEASIRFYDPLKLDQIFLWRYERLVSKHKTITIESNLYEVAPEMIGKTIEVRFNPYEMDKVYVFENGRFLMKAIPTDIKTIKSEKVPRRMPEKKGKTLSVSYLSLILEQYKKMEKDSRNKIRFQSLREAQEKEEKQKKEWIVKFEREFNVKLNLTSCNTLLGIYEQFGEQLTGLLPQVKQKLEKENITFDGKCPITLSKIFHLLRNAVLNQDGKGDVPYV